LILLACEDGAFLVEGGEVGAAAEMDDEEGDEADNNDGDDGDADPKTGLGASADFSLVEV
jgi:hypothetical protein